MELCGFVLVKHPTGGTLPLGHFNNVYYMFAASCYDYSGLTVDDVSASSSHVPNDNRAKLMYYLDCMCTIMPSLAAEPDINRLRLVQIQICHTMTMLANHILF